jgi:phosphate transport system substrate-binding protein
VDAELEPVATGAGRWTAAVGLAVVVALAAAAWVLKSDDGPVPPFLGGPRPTDATPEPARDKLVHVAGSGSNLPITRALAAGFVEQGSPPVIHASIGSGGGVRALLDGAIDLALVSRPLSPTERELGLVETPYARVPVVFAVNAGVPETQITSPELVEIFAGDRAQWSDGTPIVVLQREPGDSSHRAVDVRLPEFEDANARAYEAHAYRVLYHDDDMRDALAATPGAIGLFGQGDIQPGLPIRALIVDGITPSTATIADDSYPFAKDLAFASPGPPTGAAAQLVEYALSPPGADIIRRLGGLPPDPTPYPIPDSTHEPEGFDGD